MPKLTKEQIEAKKKYHEKRAKYYDSKLDAIKESKNKIGFKFY